MGCSGHYPSTGAGGPGPRSWGVCWPSRNLTPAPFSRERPVAKFSSRTLCLKGRKHSGAPLPRLLTGCLAASWHAWCLGFSQTAAGASALAGGGGGEPKHERPLQCCPQHAQTPCSLCACPHCDHSLPIPGSSVLREHGDAACVVMAAAPASCSGDSADTWGAGGGRTGL